MFVPRNFNNIGKVINTFTKNGGVLLRKESGLKMTDIVKEAVSKNVIPETASSFDVVRVGRDFLPNEHYTDIYTFKNEAGDIIKRVFNKIDGQNIEKRVKKYENLEPCDIEVKEKEYIQFGKRIRSFLEKNGVIQECSEECITVTPLKNPIVTIFRRIFNSNNEERIMVGEFKRGKKPKIIDNTYTPNKYNDLFFDLISSKSTKGLQKLAQNPYLLSCVSTDKKFLRRMYATTVREEHLVSTPTLIPYKDAASIERGWCSPGFDSSIHINLVDNNGNFHSRERLTNIIGHEIGHAKWDEYSMALDGYKRGFYTKEELFQDFGITEADFENIEKYASSIDKYVTAEKNFNEYYKQFAEKMARDEGRKNERRYNDVELALREKFPYSYPYQYYEAKPEYLQSSDELFLFMDSKRLELP